MNDMIVVNCYKGQTTNIETFIDDIHHNIDPNQGQPMLCIGDFNTHVANFSAEDQGQTFYVNNDKGEPIPSRWQGTRCIDFALAYNTECEQLTYDPHVYSDHKAFKGTVVQQTHGQDVSILVPTIHYGRPKQATPEQWTDTLFDIFKDFKSPEISNTEQEWTEFHTSLETHMATAFQQYAEIRPTPQKGKKDRHRASYHNGSCRKSKLAIAPTALGDCKSCSEEYENLTDSLSREISATFLRTTF